ncbi:MAG: ATP-binding protein, partial [Polyangiaceae bacterium]
RLDHEIEVHRIELEMQSDELQRARDITAASLTRYTELFDFAPIGYATIDHDSMISELNHACGRLLGGERGGFLHRSLSRFVAAADQASLADFLLRVLRGRSGEVHVCEVTLARSGPVHVRLTATLRHDDWGSILVALDDVTEARRAEAVERDASRRKDEFLSILSHELRNPLAPIRVSLAVLERTAADSPQATQARRVIDRQMSHLTRLVDDLLDVARIASGKIRLQREPVELGAVLRAVLEDQRATFYEQGVLLEGRLSPELLWVDADAARITQVLGNLLSNAAKFTPRGGRVDVSLDRAMSAGSLAPTSAASPAAAASPGAPGSSVHGEAIVRVRDTGVGIASEVLPRLFTPFVQAPQALDRSQGGLGLGLAMVKSLVEQHDGSVTVASEGLGRGTDVVLRLPLAVSAVTPRATLPPPAGAKSILLVEDNVDLLEGLKTLLEMLGHSVITAEEGSTALQLAHIHRPSLVLCDIGLPGMNGYEIARLMREDPALRDVYLVALSGYARPEDRQLSVEAGFNEHIAKPPSVDRLKQVLAHVPQAAQ